MKTVFDRFQSLPKFKKFQVVMACIMAMALLGVIPSYAWFASERSAAEMYKIEYPNALFINAAHREDKIEFELGGINVNEYLKNENGDLLDANGNVITEDSDAEPVKIQKKQYIFSVSGTNTNSYILQMVHTTNNKFTYTIYSALQANVPSGEYVAYETNPNAHTENPFLVIGDDIINTASSEIKYYIKGALVGGNYKNVDATDGTKGIKDASNAYFGQNYGSNLNVEDCAVPLYWQAEIDNLTLDDKHRFCNYYILEVTWPDRSGKVIEDKETDLLYFSVQRLN